MEQMIYRFGGGTAEGDLTMKEKLGGKGANLAEMSRAGLPVPPGFTISAACCRAYLAQGNWPDELDRQIREGIGHIESLTGVAFGSVDSPLLVSVRSGAAVSMPGMMDTILNLGLNDDTAEALARETGDRHFAMACYKRFITMFADVVSGVEHERFYQELARMGLEPEEGEAVQPEKSEEAVRLYKQIYLEVTGAEFPQDPWEQLKLASQAVFSSWNTSRAQTYRRLHAIDHLMGTAATVQAMVFGNRGNDSGTGVCFTRDPATGEKRLYGEFLLNAQGEDIVAGIRTPRDISELPSLMPRTGRELMTVTDSLERHFKDMQDIEFTIERGKLYILQARSGKRTGRAALKIAADMVTEGLITREHAVRSLVKPAHLETLLHAQIRVGSDESAPFVSGLPASPGAAVGRVAFSSERAVGSTDPVILVRLETSSDDIQGMSAAEGILTCRGGKTSHAAVVARGWGKPCVSGCDALQIDYRSRTMSNGTQTIAEGEWISIDGSAGHVYSGRREVETPDYDEDFYRFMEWADGIAPLVVRANADTPEDASRARRFGAAGIGLCRTEHMFFGADRIRYMQKMIFARGGEEREEALQSLFRFQLEDFLGIFDAMAGLPVTIRLLDPPLHEFLPDKHEDAERLREEMQLTETEWHQRLNVLQEHNPMLGHRGCRLGITYPEITAMQTRAIMEAALMMKSRGTEMIPEIMVPLVGSRAEFLNQREVIDRACEELFLKWDERVEYLVGTMIEVPRAALVADEIAREADFFSFGTNDLTQMTLGFSRDDAVRFISEYLRKGVLADDPFQTLDRKGVGSLVRMAVASGRGEKAELKIGICGEHGGDPRSIDFFVSAGLDYVSCSPFRVPVARLAAAQASPEAVTGLPTAM